MFCLWCFSCLGQTNTNKLLQLVYNYVMQRLQLMQHLSHDILREGWLYKTGPQPGSKYRKRWMSLVNRQLLYYAKPLVCNFQSHCGREWGGGSCLLEILVCQKIAFFGRKVFFQKCQILDWKSSILWKFSRKLEICSVERGICCIAVLYSLAAVFQHLTLLWACSQFCLQNGWLPWQQGSSGEKFTWYHCIARPENREVKTACNYLLREPSYSQFCPKIRCHSNGGRQGRNLNDIIG